MEFLSILYNVWLFLQIWDHFHFRENVKNKLFQIRLVSVSFILYMLELLDQ